MKNVKKLAQEVEEGNVEHKLILKPSAEERLSQLVSQLKWRLREGNGEAIYELGVSDDGFLVGLNETELESSLLTLKEMAEQLDADTSVVRRVKVEASQQTSPQANRFLRYQNDDKNVDRFAIEVLVRQRNKVLCPEIRCSMFGKKGAGKTSLLGYLANGELDDGNGSTRLNILRHRHEVETGITSSLTQKSIGFSSTGAIIRSDIYWAEGSFEESILESSAKVVTFMDTSGDQKYQKTVYGGILGNPDYLCIVVSALEKGLSHSDIELLKMSQVINNVPAFIIITKSDLVDTKQLDFFLSLVKDQLQMPFIKSLPVHIQSESDVLIAINKFKRLELLI
eukprot:NODE_5_length_72347_cov_1.339331.p23 type:complete len:339 gc:universal NODE_5_length_72347_cov_1.339331:37363-38379(+)